MAHIDFINTKKLAARIVELKDELAQLLHLESLLGKKRKRGRNIGPIGYVSDRKATGVKKAKRGKRGEFGESILKFLSTKGKEGAHVSAIASAIGRKKQNVTSYFYGTGKNVKGIKAHGKNVFSYEPKD